MDATSIFLSICAVVIAYALGWVRGRTRRRIKKQPKAICGCKHHYSFHDPKTGKCKAAIDEYWVAKETRYVEQLCSCVKYYGPQPFEGFIINELGQ